MKGMISNGYRKDTITTCRCIFCILLLLVCVFGLFGCDDDGSSDFHHGDCASIGGTLLTYGACIFPEDNRGECRYTKGSSIYIDDTVSSYYNTYCHPSKWECDFEGWTLAGRSCVPVCKVDSDCPSTDDCSNGIYCQVRLGQYQGGGGSSDPCSGCGGIFCSGTCSLCAACH